MIAVSLCSRIKGISLGQGGRAGLEQGGVSLFELPAEDGGLGDPDQGQGPLAGVVDRPGVEEQVGLETDAHPAGVPRNLARQAVCGRSVGSALRGRGRRPGVGKYGHNPSRPVPVVPSPEPDSRPVPVEPGKPDDIPVPVPEPLPLDGGNSLRVERQGPRLEIKSSHREAPGWTWILL